MSNFSEPIIIKKIGDYNFCIGHRKYKGRKINKSTMLSAQENNETVAIIINNKILKVGDKVKIQNNQIRTIWSARDKLNYFKVFNSTDFSQIDFFNLSFFENLEVIKFTHEIEGDIYKELNTKP